MSSDEEPTGAPEPAMRHGVPVTDSHGQAVLYPGREQYVALVRTLLDETFTTCSDLTAVDYLLHMQRPLPAGIVAERFEVVVNLLSIERRERVRVRVQVPESDPSVATLFDMFPGTEAMEREVFDMFGITFTDHPDLTRILMPEDWDGHPLRKDYDQGRIPVQFTTDFAARNPR
jgi:NADH-quinone oxidoreductase subunit C